METVVKYFFNIFIIHEILKILTQQPGKNCHSNEMQSVLLYLLMCPFEEEVKNALQY